MLRNFKFNSHLNILTLFWCKWGYNSPRYMRQWWNQPLSLTVSQSQKKSKQLFLSFNKKAVQDFVQENTLNCRSEDPSPRGVGQNWFLSGDHWETDIAGNDWGRERNDDNANDCQVKLSIPFHLQENQKNRWRSFACWSGTWNGILK